MPWAPEQEKETNCEEDDDVSEDIAVCRDVAVQATSEGELPNDNEPRLCKSNTFARRRLPKVLTGAADVVQECDELALTVLSDDESSECVFVAAEQAAGTDAAAKDAACKKELVVECISENADLIELRGNNLGAGGRTSQTISPQPERFKGEACFADR